ncbi:MAG: hypothetical protein ABEH35_07050 [Haloarculaceae archaeon]
MEWRCAWCGKPHEEDDPPCDNCGHNKFERAIQQVTEADPTEPVWVCPECGRQHQKNSPPCSRCGHVTLEQRQPDYSDLEEIGGTTYRDVLEPRYVAGFLVAGLLGIVLILGVAGVIDLPGAAGPQMPDAPSADTGNLSLAAVERAYVEDLNDRRTGQGADALARDDGLDEVATYYNRRLVESEYGDARPPTAEELNENFDVRCDGEVVFLPYQRTPESPVTSYDAAGLADVLGPERGDIEALTADARSRIGVDVHVAPDERVYVTVVAC